MIQPRLIDLPAKNFMYQTLNQCHNNRVTIYYYALNIGVFFIFAFIVGMVLYYCNKNKLTDYEKHQRMIKDQQYVLSKIRYYQDENKVRSAQVSGITDLPII